jgi:hypothetical protein
VSSSFWQSTILEFHKILTIIVLKRLLGLPIKPINLSLTEITLCPSPISFWWSLFCRQTVKRHWSCLTSQLVIKTLCKEG